MSGYAPARFTSALTARPTSSREKSISTFEAFLEQAHLKVKLSCSILPHTFA
jgi:hypothetical protein